MLTQRYFALLTSWKDVPWEIIHTFEGLEFLDVRIKLHFWALKITFHSPVHFAIADRSSERPPGQIHWLWDGIRDRRSSANSLMHMKYVSKKRKSDHCGTSEPRKTNKLDSIDDQTLVTGFQELDMIHCRICPSMSWWWSFVSRLMRDDVEHIYLEKPKNTRSASAFFPLDISSGLAGWFEAGFRSISPTGTHVERKWISGVLLHAARRGCIQHTQIVWMWCMSRRLDCSSRGNGESHDEFCSVTWYLTIS